jgi:hypothetical protein
MQKKIQVGISLVFIGTFCFVVLFAFRVASQDEEIIVQKKTPDEPVNIISIKTDSRKINFDEPFAKTSEWYKGLEIKVENVSNKPISYLALDLVFRRPKNLEAVLPEDKLPFGEIIRYGDMENPSDVKIAPKDTVVIALDKPRYETLKANLLALGYPKNFKGVEIEVKEVLFTDNTLWNRGAWYKQDAKNSNNFFLTELMKVETIRY